MPGKGQVEWDQLATWERLVAAIYASGTKIDLKATATCYGTTYDTLENKMRKIKKLAQTLKSEVDTGARGEVESARRSATSTPKKMTTPSKALSNVANGRVTKSSPTKGRKKNMKQESFEHATGDMLTDPTLLTGEGMGAEMHSFADTLNLDFGSNENDSFF